MTDDIEAAAEPDDRIEDMGGAVAAIERGFQKAEIERAAYEVAREIDAGERVVVGVNKFVSDGEEPYEPLRRPGHRGGAGGPARPAAARARQRAGGARAFPSSKRPRKGTGNVLYPLRDALRAEATLGEVCDALRDVWGEYRPREI